MKIPMKKTLFIIFLFLFINPIAFATPAQKPPTRNKVVKNKMTAAQIRAKRLAEWNRKHPPKRKSQKQRKAEPVNAAYLRIKRLIELKKKHPNGTYKPTVAPPKPQPKKNKARKSNQRKAKPTATKPKRVAKPAKKHTRQRTQKRTPQRTSQRAQQQILNYSSLPKFCGNNEVYHGKISYHSQAKAFYFKHFYSKNKNDFDLFKLDNIDRRLLGKSIIFAGHRYTNFTPSGRQIGAFQSIISDIKVMQIVSNKIDYNSIHRQCNLIAKRREALKI